MPGVVHCSIFLIGSEHFICRRKFKAASYSIDREGYIGHIDNIVDARIKYLASASRDWSRRFGALRPMKSTGCVLIPAASIDIAQKRVKALRQTNRDLGKLPADLIKIVFQNSISWK